ncbi:MAG: LON peptidase substrate-binding domain-containing protein, partial [Bacillota bacterium]
MKVNKKEVTKMYNPNEIFTDQLPVIAVRGVIFLPVSDIRVEIGREFTKKAIHEAEESRDGHVLLVFQQNPKIEEPEFSDFLEVGILAKIAVKIKLPNGNYKIKFTPITRVRLDDIIIKEPYYEIEFTSVLPKADDFDEQQVSIKIILKEIVENAKFLFRDQKKVLKSLRDGITSSKLSDLIASELRISENDR